MSAWDAEKEIVFYAINADFDYDHINCLRRRNDI